MVAHLAEDQKLLVGGLVSLSSPSSQAASGGPRMQWLTHFLRQPVSPAAVTFGISTTTTPHTHSHIHTHSQLLTPHVLLGFNNAVMVWMINASYSLWYLNTCPLLMGPFGEFRRVWPCRGKCVIGGRLGDFRTMHRSQFALCFLVKMWARSCTSCHTCLQLCFLTVAMTGPWNCDPK